MLRRPATKTVPVHWSLLLGVVSAAALFVLAVTGVILLFFFDPSSDTVRYDGSYPLLRGVTVSKAYESTLLISFDVHGGLLVRQAHHWAALVLPASLIVQMLYTFFSGGFRRPRQWSWVLLFFTFVLALAGGWSGYGLPDDMLAGTGLRIAQSILVGTPLIGTWASFVLLGGEFPGAFVERLYWLHVAVVPVLLTVVLALRARLAWTRKPAQFPGPGRTSNNVVGLPLKAFMVRASGLFLITVGVLTMLAATITINPIWIYGPASAGHASAGSQPDWYTGFLDGALRLVPPGWEVHIFGGTVPLGVLLPQVLVAGFLTTIAFWPFLESRATGDRAEHDLLDRPRNRPVRTGLGVAGLTFFVDLWASGSTDLVATQLHVSFEHQVLALRTLLFVGPLAAFQLTRALCVSLAQGERDRLVRGFETGIIVRDLEGGYRELHAPVRGASPTVSGSTDPHLEGTPASSLNVASGRLGSGVGRDGRVA